MATKPLEMLGLYYKGFFFFLRIKESTELMNIKKDKGKRIKDVVLPPATTGKPTEMTTEVTNLHQPPQVYGFQRP